jgi:hypothetical protein
MSLWVTKFPRRLPDAFVDELEIQKSVTFVSSRNSQLKATLVSYISYIDISALAGRSLEA